MQEEAPRRRSVAELAGRFTASASPRDAAGNETDKLVRRRPPCSLQLPKTHGDDPEPPGVTSPLPAKTKRNSALMEKIQALALSPSSQQSSPKSPGHRLLLPAFPGSVPVTTVTTSSSVTPTSPVATSPRTEEEVPASFEAPPTTAEGSILSSINKSRPRHSIKRRPPSRRHRKSSSGDEVSVADVADKAAGEEGKEVEDKSDETKEDKSDEAKEDKSDETKEDKSDEAKEDKSDETKEDKSDEAKEDKSDEAKEDKSDAPTCPEENHKEDQSKTEPGKEDEKEGENRSMGGEEGDTSPSETKEEEKTSGEKHREDVSEGATNPDSTEEKSGETRSRS
ncbi:duboraya isoform X2 [Toxotes jaculatrix]|uniref:duboraya isoform X2 n=1 Tax=Toxotes jaculatrix TaxID=941984 RepID=UPI001B3A844C|nr:duboraya isoform X2 [Toxotes jaculatrix]